MATVQSVPAATLVDDVLVSATAGSEVRPTLDLLTRRITEQSGFDFAAVLLSDEDARHVRLAGVHNFPERYEQRLSRVFEAPIDDPRFAGSSPTSRALRTAQTTTLQDAGSEAWYAPWRPLAEAFGFGSLVSVPLRWDGETHGVLNGYFRDPREFTPDHVETFEAGAGDLARAVRVALHLQAQHEAVAALTASGRELARHQAMLERAGEHDAALKHAVLAGADCAEVSQLLSGLLGRAVVVTAPDGGVLCTSQPAPDPAMLQALRPPRHGRRHPGTTPPAAVSVPILVGDDVAGEVSVLGDPDAWDELDLRTLHHGATALAVRAATERAARRTEQRLHSGLLEALVHGDRTTAELRERAAFHGLDLTAEHRVVIVVAEAPELLGRVGDRLATQLPGAVHAAWDGRLVLLVPAALPAEACRAALARVRTAVAGQGTPALWMGVGTAAPGAEGCRASHAEAERCVAALRRLHPGGGLMLADELGVLGMFLDSNRPEQLVASGRKLLGPLLEYDDRTGGALVQTLGIYLDTSCDPRSCASRLFVHHNTIKYRLRKIEELSGLDLRRPEDLLRATVARLSLKLLGEAALT